ncbi:MAG: M14 family zinc carboxypeptidase [Capnocytophaga sp.]|nr:M14 family zinc carboxypeptidase [Capnocytophaga sp.]
MKRLVSICILLLYAQLAVGQWFEPKKVTDKFFPDPDIAMDIPVFNKNSGFTTYEEMNAFLKNLQEKYPSVMQIEYVGKTQRGKDIPLVILKNNTDNHKTNVLYFGRVHGDEPSGTEALLYLVQQLPADASMLAWLDTINLYIMPMVNIDGAQSNNRRTANTIDLNRDQSKLDTPEARSMHQVVARVDPQLIVDFHEYQPDRSDWLRITPKVVTTPFDVMFLYSGNPNVPDVFRDVITETFIKSAMKVLDQNELTHHAYYSSSRSFDNVNVTVGGASPRSTANAMALKNKLSLIIETRGIRLGRTSMKRRVWGAYLVAKDILATTVANTGLIESTLEKGLEDSSDIAVRFQAERVADNPMPFLDMVQNEMIHINVDTRYSTQSVPTLTRAVPMAYYINPSQERAIEILTVMGVEIDTLEADTEVEAEIFTVRSLADSPNEVGGVYPVAVRTRKEIVKKKFAKGTYVIRTNQPLKRAITVLLEPESGNGFANYKVIPLSLHQEFPVYRILK